ncbi:MAG: TlpA disulfide reductase family protein [Elusimicrobiota bacterium]|nr:TlpA disulfide reductase family protein [Elusimicrobiota bacterium]
MKKQINLLILTAIMFAGIGCAKDNKEPGKTEAPYQKKDTYFSLPNRNGGNIDLADYKDKSVTLIFFAHYCPYCKKAAPFMNRIYDTYKDKGLIVLGISTDKNKDTANIFATEQKLDFPIAYNGAEISMQYKTRGVPYIFVLDKKHEIMDFWAGYDESYDAEIIETIAKVLGK